MSKNYPVVVYQGSGGVKQVQQDPDNLFGREVVEMFLGYGQGVVYGLENGLNSVLVDGSPLVNASGELNIEEFVFSFHQGYEDDTRVKFILSGESSIDQSSAGQLLHDQVKVFDISGVDIQDLSQIDLRFNIPALYYIHIYDRNYLEHYIALEIRYRFPNKDPNKWYYIGNEAAYKAGRTIYNQDGTLMGNKSGRSESLRLRLMRFFGYDGGFGVRPPSAAYTFEEIKNMYLITGQTTTGYNLEIPVPLKFKGEDVQIEIRKLKIAKSTLAQNERDNNPDQKSSIFYIESNYIGVPEKTYAGLAGAHIVAGVTDRFQNLPDIILTLKGQIVDVPINYNSETKVYDGEWFGSSFKKAWTDNPVWILRFFIMNPKLGLRRVRPQLMVNEFEFYEAAQYCDQKIKDVDGQFKIHRYTYNDLVSEIRDFTEFLDYVAGTFNAKLVDYGDSFGLRVDGLNTEVKMQFTIEGITVDGFSYSFSALETRYNEIKVTFLNKELDYSEDRRRIFNQTSIDTYGLMSYDFQAVGCTNFKEALRKAYYLMLTNQTEYISVSFQVPRLGIYLSPFDVISICDESMGWGVSGKVNTYDAEKIYLRDALSSLNSGEYTLELQTRYGLVDTLVMFDQEQPYELVFQDETFYSEYGNIEGLNFSLSSEDVGKPQTFKVLNTSEVSGGSDLYAVEAVLLNSGKYAKVDNVLVSGGSDGIVVPLVGSNSLSQYNQTPDKPAMSVVSGKYIVDSDGDLEVRCVISGADPKAKRWRVVYSKAGLGSNPTTLNLNVRQFSVPKANDGDSYSFQVFAYSAGGKESPKRIVNHLVEVDELQEMPAPFDFKVTNFDENTRMVTASWADYAYSTREAYYLKVFSGSTEMASILVGNPVASTHTFFFTAPVGNYEVRIYPVEAGLMSSSFNSEVLTITTTMIPAPLSGSVDYDETTTPKSVKASWLARPEPQLLDYYLAYTVNSGAVTELYLTDNFKNVSLSVGGDYLFSIKTRSLDGVLSTDVLELNFAAGDVQLAAPENGQIFVFGDQLKAEWEENTSAYFLEFDVEIYRDGVLESLTTTDNFIVFDSEPDTNYLVKVRAKSTFNLTSLDSLDLTYSLDNVVLNAPEGVSLSLDFNPTKLVLALSCSDFTSEFFKAFKVEYYLGGVLQTTQYPTTLNSSFEITTTGLWSVKVFTQSITNQLSAEASDSLQVDVLYEPLKLEITSDILDGLNLWDYFQANYSGDYATEYGSVYYVDFIIKSGIMVTSSDAALPAIVKDSNWPNGSVPRVIIEPDGIAAGRGGRAGKSAVFVGSSAVDSLGVQEWLSLPAENGQTGGTCFLVDHAEPLVVVNQGICAGGGGGQGGHGGFVVNRNITSFNQYYAHFIHASSGGGAPYGKKQYRPSDYEFMVEHYGFPEYNTLTTAVDSPHKAYWYWYADTGQVRQSTSGLPTITTVSGFPTELVLAGYDSVWASATFYVGNEGQTSPTYDPDVYAQKRDRLGNAYYNNQGELTYAEAVRDNVFNSEDGGRLSGGRGGLPLSFRHESNLYNVLGFIDYTNAEVEVFKNRYGLGKGGDIGLKGSDGKDFTEVVRLNSSLVGLQFLSLTDQSKYLKAQESGGLGGQAGFVWEGIGGISLTGNPPIGR